MNEQYTRAAILEGLYEFDIELKAIEASTVSLPEVVKAMNSAENIVKSAKTCEGSDDGILERAFTARQAVKDLWTAAESHGLMSISELNEVYVSVVAEFVKAQWLYDLLEDQTRNVAIILQNHIRKIPGSTEEDKSFHVVNCSSYLKKADERTSILESLDKQLATSLAPTLLPLVKCELLPSSGPSVQCMKLESEASQSSSNCYEEIVCLSVLFDRCKEKTDNPFLSYTLPLLLESALNEEARKRVLHELQHSHENAISRVIEAAREQVKKFIDMGEAIRSKKPERIKEAHANIVNSTSAFPLKESLTVMTYIAKNIQSLSKLSASDYKKQFETTISVFPKIVLHPEEMTNAETGRVLDRGAIHQSAQSVTATVDTGLEKENNSASKFVSLIIKIFGGLLCATGICLAFVFGIGAAVSDENGQIFGIIAVLFFSGVSWFGYRLGHPSAMVSDGRNTAVSNEGISEEAAVTS